MRIFRSAAEVVQGLGQVSRMGLGPVYDNDAAKWFGQVEDTGATFGPVEAAIASNKLLINNQIFVGCKADPSPIPGISNFAALKVFGLTVGASSLAGAQVPIKGAPTFLNYVAGDYNRLTGLLGNLTTKGINSNRAQDADPRDNFAAFNYYTQAPTQGGSRRYIGINTFNSNRSILIADGTNLCRTPNPGLVAPGSFTSTGLIGFSRHLASDYTIRRAQTSILGGQGAVAVSAVTTNFNYDSGTNYLDGRSGGYGVGEALDLAALEARIAAVIAGLV